MDIDSHLNILTDEHRRHGDLLPIFSFPLGGGNKTGQKELSDEKQVWISETRKL